MDFLIVGDSNAEITVPLDDKYRTPIVTLILSTYRHLDLVMFYVERLSEFQASTVESSTGLSSAMTTRWLEEATSTILNRMPSILRVCKVRMQTE